MALDSADQDRVKLFGREYKFFYRGPVGSDEIQTIEITRNHIRFDIRKTTHPEPNTAHICISNLNEETRQSMKHRGARIHLEAGYHTDVPLVFTGDVREINHIWEKGTWITTIYAGDGERAYTQAVCPQGFEPKTPKVEVVKACASEMGKLGTAAEKLDLPGTYDRGFTSTGLASTTLTKALEGTGYLWSIQDGRVVMRKETEPYRSFVYEWAPNTGLEGSPTHVTPKNTLQTPNSNPSASALDTPGTVPAKNNKRKGAQPGSIKAKGRLQGRIQCGGAVKIDSEFIKGTFICDVVNHRGDTWTHEWTTEIEGVPYLGVKNA